MRRTDVDLGVDKRPAERVKKTNRVQYTRRQALIEGMSASMTLRKTG